MTAQAWLLAADKAPPELPIDRSTLVLIGVGLVVLWVLHSALWPIKPCPSCKGGKNRSPKGTSFNRRCRSCKGKGEIPRVLPRIWRLVTGYDRE